MKKFYETPAAELCWIKMSDIMIFESGDSSGNDPVVTDREYSKLY